MREAVGGTWLFQIVIVFILLFAGFMALTINRSKAFNVKDRIIQTLQTYNGIQVGTECVNNEDNVLCDIASYLNESAYRTTGNCPDNVVINGNTYPYQGYTKDGKQTSSNNAAFCIARIENHSTIASSACGGSGCITSELPSMIYYRVTVFYQLDLPIFHDVFNFKIQGDTKLIVGGGL